MKTQDPVVNGAVITVQNLDHSELTEQQAIIFGLLNSEIGTPVPMAKIISDLGSICAGAEPTVGSVKVQIHRVRKKVSGHYRIETLVGKGYRMCLL